jgi:twitching motility protein PilI
MAKREALRELQTRLAKRLQTAQSEGLSVSWLAVRAAGHNYLLPLAQSGEIVALSALQQAPYTKPWFLGVLNIRGNLFGVVGLADFVRASGAPAPGPVTATTTATPTAPLEASVVTLNTGLEVNCGLQVDSLAGLRGADAFASSSAAAPGAPEFFGLCFVDTEGQRWQEINLRALSRFAPFLSIGA